VGSLKDRSYLGMLLTTSAEHEVNLALRKFPGQGESAVARDLIGRS
jgi:hypothetical protein